MINFQLIMKPKTRVPKAQHVDLLFYVTVILSKLWILWICPKKLQTIWLVGLEHVLARVWSNCFTIRPNGQFQPFVGGDGRLYCPDDQIQIRCQIRQIQFDILHQQSIHCKKSKKCHCFTELVTVLALYAVNQRWEGMNALHKDWLFSNNHLANGVWDHPYGRDVIKISKRLFGAACLSVSL